MELFDYIRAVFSNDEKQWNDIPQSIKRKNFWMLNRFMSIQYPIQASYLCHYKSDPIVVSDYWHRTLAPKFSTTPKWIYAKTIKKKDQEKKMDLPSNEMIKWHCAHHEMTRSDFDMNVKMFGEKFVDEVKKFEKVLRSQGVLS